MNSIRVAIRALSANALRTTLTMLGIVIGVAAVIALMSIGRGAQVQVTSQIQSLGTNLLFVAPAKTADGLRSRSLRGGTLTLEDAAAIARLPTVVAVAPELAGVGQLTANGRHWSTSLIGVKQQQASVRNIRLAAGEWLQPQHVDGRSSVVVLGSTVAHELFGDGAPTVGQSIRIRADENAIGIAFRVIGVAARGDLGEDDQAWVPLTTLETRLISQHTVQGAASLSTINVQVVNVGQTAETESQVGDLLRARHGAVHDDFTVQSQQDLLNTITDVSTTFNLVLGAIASISLAVGGIGIMNIMLVSVTERTREIGIRKTVGARDRDILSQFLVEATVVSLGGGVVGIGLGIGVAQLLSAVLSSAETATTTQAFRTIVTADSVATALVVAASVGLGFGLYPALRAAKLSPGEALRCE